MNAINRTLRLKAEGMTAPLVTAAQSHAKLMRRIAERNAFENAPQTERFGWRSVCWCVLGAVGFWAFVVVWGCQP